MFVTFQLLLSLSILFDALFTTFMDFFLSLGRLFLFVCLNGFIDSILVAFSTFVDKGLMVPMSVSFFSLI